MELAADEPGMVRHLDDLHVHAIGSASGDTEAGARKRLIVFAIEFVAVAMALRNLRLPVGLVSKGTGLEFAVPRTQAHGSAHLVHTQKLPQFVDHSIRRRW